MGLIEDLGRGPVGLDTVIFVYWVEDHPRFASMLEPLFAELDAQRLEAVTSGITLLEALVVPYRMGDAALVHRYEVLLRRSRGLRLVELDRPLLRAAAHLRAQARVSTPDALQLVAALGARSTAYLTNDRSLPPVPGLQILQLRDYVRPAPAVSERRARAYGAARRAPAARPGSRKR